MNTQPTAKKSRKPFTPARHHRRPSAPRITEVDLLREELEIAYDLLQLDADPISNPSA